MEVSQLMRYPSGSRPAGSNRGPQQARADMASREVTERAVPSSREEYFLAGEQSPSVRRGRPHEEVKKV